MWRLVIIVVAAILLQGWGQATAEEPTETRIPIGISRTISLAKEVVVERGDHLWKISARHLEGSDRPIAPYWAKLIELNVPNLRSGDPDLIFPGEIVRLPALP